MRDFKNFEVTKLARKLTVRIYDLLPLLPVDERFALCQQFRRASISVGANIAEGAGRHTDRDFAHFLTLAVGSLSELEYLMLITVDLGYLDSSLQKEIDSQMQLLKKKLYRFRESLLQVEK